MSYLKQMIATASSLINIKKSLADKELTRSVSGKESKENSSATGLIFRTKYLFMDHYWNCRNEHVF